MNPVGIATTLVRCLTFSSTLVDPQRYDHDFSRPEVKLREQYRANMDLRTQIEEFERAAQSERDWSMLARPFELIKAIKRVQMIGNKCLIAVVVQLLVMLYLIIKCIFHLYLTGDNFELALYYERHYYFPRLFSSHETPHIFYKHCLALMLYCFSIRLLAVSRVIHYSILNANHYERVPVSQINITILAFFKMDTKYWMEFFRDTLKHWQHCAQSYKCLQAHLAIDSKQIDEKFMCRSGLDHSVNLIDFYECYKPYLADKSSGGEPRRDLWSNYVKAWRSYRICPYYLTVAVMLCMIGTFVALYSVGLVIICTIFFELDGTVREREKRQLSFTETIAYLPQYFEEPWRLLRFLDMMLFTFLQLPTQVDGMIYYNDIFVMISRAEKVFCCLEYDRKLCTLGSGEFYDQVFTHYNEDFKRMTSIYSERKPAIVTSISSSISNKVRKIVHEMDAKQRPMVDEPVVNHAISYDHQNHQDHNNDDDDDDDDEREPVEDLPEELCVRYNSWLVGSSKKAIDYLSPQETEKLNKRLYDLLRMVQVLKMEFIDVKRFHSLYLNTMVIYSGFCIAYCASLMINATSYSTFFPLIVNTIAVAAPMSVTILLSIILDNKLKGINRNINLLLVNERSYLTKQTLKYLMIQSHAFATSRDRSIQIAGQFSITPESLGPLIAYISTCMLLLSRF